MTAVEQYRPNELTNDQIELIKRTIAKDATNDELQLFVTQANKKGLDPFSGQIWFTKRQGKMSILTGIEGYRLIADRTGLRAGTESWWCGEDGIWKDVWLSRDKPSASKVTVQKLLPNGDRAAYTGIALWSEYGANADGFMFKKMPAAQLRKCAEALALRMAFSAETAGLYVQEEMDQADRPVPVRADVVTGEIEKPVYVDGPEMAVIEVQPTRRREPPHKTVPDGYVPALTAKKRLLEELAQRGIGEDAAKTTAKEMWGTRGSNPIHADELAELIASLGPVQLFDDGEPFE